MNQAEEQELVDFWRPTQAELSAIGKYEINQDIRFFQEIIKLRLERVSPRIEELINKKFDEIFNFVRKSLTPFPLEGWKFAVAPFTAKQYEDWIKKENKGKIPRTGGTCFYEEKLLMFYLYYL